MSPKSNEKMSTYQFQTKPLKISQSHRQNPIINRVRRYLI